MAAASRVIQAVRVRPRAARQSLMDSLPAILLALVLALLVFPPFLFMLQTSVTVERGADAGTFTLDHFATVASSLASGSGLLGNSLLFAAGSALLGLVLGGTLAWLAERTDAPFRPLAYIAAFVSFAIPGIIKVVAWILLLGPNAGFVNVWLAGALGLSGPAFNIFSMGGMVFVEGLLWTPVVFLLLATPFRSMDPTLEEAAMVSGANQLTTMRRITLRLALPTVLTILILTAIRSLEAFDIPALIGIPANVEVLTTRIYLQVTRGGIFPRHGDASAYATLLVLLIVLLFIPYYRLTRHAERFATITGKAFRPRRVQLGRWRWLGGLALLVLPFLEVLPLLVMFWASLLPFIQPPSVGALNSLTLANFGQAFSDPGLLQSVLNTAVVTIATATGVTVLTLLTAWVVVRTRLPWRWVLDQTTTFPLIFPGIVLGLAVLRTYLEVPIGLYGTIWILVVAYITRSLPLGMRFSHAGLLGIHRELEESASTSGATWLGRIRYVVLPLMLPALFACWISVFLVSTRDLSAALLLYSPGAQVLSITIWELWQNGQVTVLAAFSVVTTLILLAISAILFRISGGRGVAT